MLKEEQTLRKHIRVLIERKHQKQLNEENLLRSFIKKIIKEAKIEDSPTRSTGINKLVGTLKVILPTIERAYKSLTTNIKQRESFKKHLIKAFIDTLSPVDVLSKIDAGSDQAMNTEDDLAPISEQAAKEPDAAMTGIDTNPKGINIDIADEIDPTTGADVKAASAEEKEKEKEEQKKLDQEAIKDVTGEDRAFPEIPGLDETGRDEAVDIYKRTTDAIIRTYRKLHNDEDKEHFKDYLVTNLLLYFDKWESDIGDVPEISTPEYQAAAGEKEKYLGAGEEEPADAMALQERIKKAAITAINNY